MGNEVQLDLFETRQPLTWQQLYRKVLSSKRWKLMKERLARERGGCVRCGRQSDLELHHVTYDRLGNEADGDVQVFCVACHPVADAAREMRVEEKRRQRSAARLYQARFEGYARKKYGEEWEGYCDIDSVQNEFDEWIERKG